MGDLTYHLDYLCLDFRCHPQKCPMMVKLNFDCLINSNPVVQLFQHDLEDEHNQICCFRSFQPEIIKSIFQLIPERKPLWALDSCHIRWLKWSEFSVREKIHNKQSQLISSVTLLWNKHWIEEKGERWFEETEIGNYWKSFLQMLSITFWLDCNLRYNFVQRKLQSWTSANFRKQFSIFILCTL